MSKLALKAAPSDLEVVDVDNLPETAKSHFGANLELLGKRIAEELRAISTTEAELDAAEKMLASRRSETSLRALIIGTLLLQAKAGLGHGGFGKFKTEHFGSGGNRQANYYMKLAEKFCRDAGILMPEFLALPQSTLDLTGGPTDAANAMKKARSFVGNRSLADLLELHGLKVRGGYHPSEEAVQKWLADTHPKQVGKTYAELSEEQQLAYQQSGYNDRDWRTPAEIRKADTEAAHAALRSPIVTLGEELDRTEWRQFVSPPDLVALRREAMDVVAKIDQRIAEMEGR